MSSIYRFGGWEGLLGRSYEHAFWTGIKAPQVMPGGPTPRYHLSQPGLGWEVDGTAPELTESPTAMQGVLWICLALTTLQKASNLVFACPSGWGALRNALLTTLSQVATGASMV